MRSLDLRRRIDELVEDPQRVKTLEDHELLYCSRRTLRAFDFLRSAPMEAGDWSAARARTPADKLQALMDHTAATGGDVLYAELTPPDIAALGLHVVRAILPGFQPIAFGAAEARLGGHRLYELPRRLGLRKERTTRSELNPDPHPLA